MRRCAVFQFESVCQHVWDKWELGSFIINNISFVIMKLNTLKSQKAHLETGLRGT